LEVVFNVFNIESELIVCGTEVVLILGVISNDANDIRVSDSDTSVVEVLLSFEGFASVEDNFLENHSFFGSEVTDDLDVTVVRFVGLGYEFSFGSEVDFGDVRLGLRLFLVLRSRTTLMSP